MRECVGVGHKRDFEHKHREDRADGIDQHTFGFEHRCQTWTQTHLSDKRANDGWAGHRDETSEKSRKHPRPA